MSDSEFKTRDRSLFRRHRRKVLTAVVCCGALGLDVLGANVRNAIYPVDPPASFRVRSDLYHHGLAPMKTVRARWGRRHYPLHTNSLGFKDRAAREVPLRSSKRRILFIGDSFTEGIGVPYERTFVGLVEEALAKQNVEVLNAGVCSYCPTLSVARVNALLHDVGLRFDELVVYLDISDAHDEPGYALDEKLRVRPTDLKAGSEPSARRDPLKEFVNRNTVLLGAALRFLYDRVKPEPSRDWLRGRWTYDESAFAEYGREGLDHMTRSMDLLHALVNKEGIPLTVAVYPWPNQLLHDTPDSLQVRHWRAWAARKGVRFVDHFGDFMNGDPQTTIEDLFILGDFHWNERGHALVARRFLSERAKR